MSTSLLDLIRAKKADIAAASGDRTKTIKPAMGSGTYRILSSWRGDGQQFWADFGQHYVKDSTGKISAVYVCSAKTFGRECAVCAAIEEAKRHSPDEVTSAIIDEAKSSARVLVNVLHIDGATPNDVQILDLSPTAFGAFCTIMEEYETEGQSLFDATTGRSVIISRSGAGKTTKYAVMASVKPTPIPASVWPKLHNLDDYVKQESAAQELRALNSLRAVTGLLPAPAGGGAYSGMPRAASAAMGAADPYAAAPAKRAPAAPVSDFDDVPDLMPARAAAARPTPVATPVPTPAAAPVSEGTGDPDLDALLAGLD